jgi:hypothetical protein
VWAHAFGEASKLIGRAPNQFDSIWSQDESREFLHIAGERVNYRVCALCGSGMCEGGNCVDVCDGLLCCMSSGGSGG